MKCLDGPWHVGFGISITLRNRIGHQETITLVGGKEMVEGLAQYLVDADTPREAKPMAAGTPAKSDPEAGQQ